jgi:hypothetical protein
MMSRAVTTGKLTGRREASPKGIKPPIDLYLREPKATCGIADNE